MKHWRPRTHVRLCMLHKNLAVSLCTLYIDFYGGLRYTSIIKRGQEDKEMRVYKGVVFTVKVNGEECAISLSCTDRVYNIKGTQSYGQSYALTLIDTLTSCDEA